MAVLNDGALRQMFQYYAKLNPASIDLSLSPYVTCPRWYWRLPEPIYTIHWKYILGKPNPWVADDKQSKPNIFWGKPHKMGMENDPQNWHWLKKYQMVLLSSDQKISIPNTHAGLLVTTSTTGRAGLNHSHSGWLDPEFEGYVTFEFQNISLWPIPLYHGRIVVQIVMFTLLEAAELGYSKTGRYNMQSIEPQQLRSERL